MAKRASKPSVSADPDSYAEIGSTGLLTAGGYVNEEWLDKLQGHRQAKVFREMRDNDPIVGAVMFAIEMLLRQVEWKVEAASDKPEDQEHAEFLDACRQDMATSWADMMAEIISMLTYGFAPLEIVYKVRGGPRQADGARRSKFQDGRIGWRKLSLRGQETILKWKLDDGGGIKGLTQNAYKVAADGELTTLQQVFIPIEKLLLFRTTAYKNNPTGRSLLRNAFRPWYFKKKIEEIEATGIERGLAGFPVVRIPAICMSKNATPDQKAIYTSSLALARRIRLDQEAGIVLASDRDENGDLLYDLELKGIDGRRTADTTGVIERNSRHIAMTVLADFILLGHEKVGSFSLSSDKTDLFAVALGAILDSVEDVFNRFAVPRLFDINGVDLDELPQLRHGDVESQNLAEIVEYLSGLNGLGMPLLPDDNLEDHLRRLAKLPERSHAAGQNDVLAAASRRAAQGRSKGSADREDEAQDEADDAAGQARPKGKKPKAGAARA